MKRGKKWEEWGRENGIAISHLPLLSSSHTCTCNLMSDFSCVCDGEIFVFNFR